MANKYAWNGSRGIQIADALEAEFVKDLAFVDDAEIEDVDTAAIVDEFERVTMEIADAADAWLARYIESHGGSIGDDFAAAEEAYNA